MKRGHVTGHKKERCQRGTPWYAAIEEERIRKVEAEWGAKTAQTPPPDAQQH